MNVRQSNCELLHSPVLFGGIFLLLMISSAVASQADGANVKQLNTDEMLKALEMLGTKIRGNYEAIETWEGAFEFVDEGRYPGGVSDKHGLEEITDNQERAPTVPGASDHVTIISGVVEFTLDRAADRLNVLKRPTGHLKLLDLASGRKWQRTTPGGAYHWSLTSDHFLELGINTYYGQISGFPRVDSVTTTGGRIVFRKPPSTRTMGLVDPRDFFREDIMRFFWQHCERYASALRGERTERSREFAMTNVSIVQTTSPSGIRYVMMVKYPNPQEKEESENAPRRSEMTFDSSTGFNPTLYLYVNEPGAPPLDKKTIEYEKVSGIFVPKRYEYVHFNPSQPDRIVPSFSRTLTRLESTLNNPIDTAEFAVERFDVQYGERMLDEIENRIYVKDQSGFVPVEEFVFDPALLPGATPKLDSPNGGIGATLIIINAAIVIGLVIVILWRRINQAA